MAYVNLDFRIKCMSLTIIGISALDKESTVSLIQDGKIVAAISEERLTRVKQQPWFPWRSLERIMQDYNLTKNDIDYVGFAFLPADEEWRLRKERYKQSVLTSLRYFSAGTIPHILNFTRIMGRWTMHTKQHLALVHGLKYYGLLDKLVYVHHHVGHAASAYYTSGFDECLVVTMDALGSGASGGVYLANPQEGLKLVYQIPFPHSVAILYQRLTVALGFKPDRHEGKVLGLAAYGNPNKLYPQVRKRFVTHPGTFIFKDAMNPLFEKRLAKRYNREDVAAAYQRVLEDIVTDFVDYYVKKYNQNKVAVAGGLFANVKGNQRITELPSVEQLFIHPAMGDQGIGSGAALQIAFEQEKIRPYKLPDIYFGPSYSDAEMRQALEQQGLTYQRFEEIEPELARLLAAGHTVGRFNGRMEYGPRALGNRTIMAPATDKSINDTLNKKLRRTEFMPFAPAVLEEDAEQCFIGVNKARHAAAFMTITFDCTEFMKHSMPAAVHVDDTARPQLVSRETNPSFYKIIQEYKRLTGLPGIINTSFNIHEEPIVCSPNDAIRGFLDGELDYLALGNYLVRYEANHQAFTARGAGPAIPDTTLEQYI